MVLRATAVSAVVSDTCRSVSACRRSRRRRRTYTNTAATPVTTVKVVLTHVARSPV